MRVTHEPVVCILADHSLASRLVPVGMYPAATPSMTALAGDPRALLLAEAVAKRATLPRSGTYVDLLGVVDRVGDELAALEDDAGFEEDEAGTDELLGVVDVAAGVLLAFVELAGTEDGRAEDVGAEDGAAELASLDDTAEDGATKDAADEAALVASEVADEDAADDGPAELDLTVLDATMGAPDDAVEL